MDEMQKRLIKDYWDQKHEDMLNRELETNDELRKLFEKHPEKKEQYKFKILDSEDEVFGRCHLTIQQCETCMFCLQREPFGRLPENGDCMIFENGKPNAILFDGAPCEYYEKQK